MSHQVEDTAFVIAHYRATDPSFSKDPYASFGNLKEQLKLQQRLKHAYLRMMLHYTAGEIERS